MPLLQVRDCPEDLYKKISMHARRQNRTIAQQIIVILEKGLGQEISNAERRRQVLDKINIREVPDTVAIIDDVAQIRQDRDR